MDEKWHNRSEFLDQKIHDPDQTKILILGKVGFQSDQITAGLVIPVNQVISRLSHL